MDNNRVTVRYARALLQASLETNVLDDVLQDVSILFESLKKFKGFRDFIDSPFIKPSEKQHKLTELFGETFNPLTLNLVNLVVTKNRELFLENICRNFIDYGYKEKGVTKAWLTMAASIDETVLNRLIQVFEEKLETAIELNRKEDERLIGGFVFQVDGYQYDASVANKLKQIRKNFQL